MIWLKILFSFLGVFAVTVGYIFTRFYSIGLCERGISGCLWAGYEFTVGKPLFNLALAFFVASLLFLFASKKSFYRWLGFSVPYLALSAYLIYVSPVSHHSRLLLDPTKEDVSRWLAILFFALSFIYFFIRFWKEKRQRPLV